MIPPLDRPPYLVSQTPQPFIGGFGGVTKPMVKIIVSDPKQQAVIVRLDLTFLGRYSPFHENNQNGSGGGGNDELVEATTRGGSIEAMACP